MSDYYSHRDHSQTGRKQGYTDYADTGSGSKWLWVGIILVAIVALFGVGLSGAGTAVDEASPAVQPATTEAAPAVPSN